MSKRLVVAKATLSTGKVVSLREMKISDTELAAQEAAPKSNGDGNLLQILMQKILVRNLLVQVDGKELSAVEREDMDSLFKPGEYGQLCAVVKEMMGGDDAAKKPRIEVVSYGDN